MSETRLPSACLSEDRILAFAAGQLSEAERDDAEGHFDDCEICQRLLSEAVHALAPTAGPTRDEPAPWSTTFRTGMLVGQRYEIRRFIARGGMGEVYEAFDHELQERVALKTVTSTSGDNPSAVRRLKAEVQLARRVSHSSVCRIYDFGTHATPSGGPQVCFLTMEFVEGPTLGARLRQGGALEVHEATALARALLLGLQAAHDAGVLHRDFKSDNVMLRTDAQGTTPVILDFGLARAFDRPSDQSSSSHHGFVGTFAYVAPEQLEGHPHSTASDIYSFGLVWFEMLTGELPFKTRSSPAMTTLDRLTKPVRPPSARNAKVPPGLDQIVLGCLRRARAERFQTANDVLRRLDAFEREAPPPRRRSWIPFALTVGAGAAIAAIALPSERSAETPLQPVSVAAAAAARAQRDVPRPALEPAMSSPPASAAPPPRPPAAPSVSQRKPGGPAPTSPKASSGQPPPPPPPAAAAIQAPEPTAIGWENPFAD